MHPAERNDFSNPNPFESPDTVARAPVAPSTRLQSRPVAVMFAGVFLGMLCTAISGALAFPVLMLGAYSLQPRATNQQRDVRTSESIEIRRTLAAGAALGTFAGGAYGAVMGAVVGILYGSMRRVDRRNTFWQAVMVFAGGATSLMAVIGFMLARYSDSTIALSVQFVGFALTGLATGLGGGVGTAVLLRATALRWRDAMIDVAVIDAEVAG